MGQYGVVVFRSTHHAIKAERSAQKAGLEVRLIPAPRDISHDCGVALRFLSADHDRLAFVLDSDAVEYERIIPSHS